LDEGDEITLLGCNASLVACDVNLNHEIKTCMQCIGRRSAGLKLLSKRIVVEPLYLLTDQNREEIKSIKTTFANLTELKNLRIEGFDVGYGVLSSLISATRNPAPDMSAMKDQIERLLVSSLSVYRSIQNYLSSNIFDRVYAYNGRYALDSFKTSEQGY
jgi:hypothetical protein